MFKSYSLRRDPINDHYEFTIYDDDFIETLAHRGSVSYDSLLSLLISFYEKKNLDVARNLFKALLFIKEYHGYNYFIPYFDLNWTNVLWAYIPASRPYISKLEKYLVYI